MKKLFELLQKVANENGYQLVLDGRAILIKDLEGPIQEDIGIQTFGIGNGIGLPTRPDDESIDN